MNNEKHYTKLIIGLVLLAMLQVLDLFTTLRAIEIAGNAVEANPITGFFIEHGWFWQFKVIIAGAAITAFWYLRNSIRSTRFVWIGVTIYTLVVASNMWQLNSVGELL